MYVPSHKELQEGCEAYVKNEGRDAMYKVATFLIEHFWGNAAEMANGLGVLLYTWNQAFYRNTALSFECLEACIHENIGLIERFRDRDILSLSDDDKPQIEVLFGAFNEALQITRGQRKGVKSPVGTAKALHLLAPNFFPLWDMQIAKEYNCKYEKAPASQYFLFCKKIKDLANQIGSYTSLSSRTLVKIIDEYNYSKYSKKWIK